MAHMSLLNEVCGGPYWCMFIENVSISRKKYLISIKKLEIQSLSLKYIKISNLKQKIYYKLCNVFLIRKII